MLTSDASIGHRANVLFIRGNLQSVQTEEVISMSDEMFVPMKTLDPEEQDQLSGISLPR